MEPNQLWEGLEGLWIQYGVSVISALAILVLGWLFARLARRALRGVLSKREVDATIAGFLASIVYMLLLALVVITAAGRLGIPTASFAAVIAAAGLAIGLALQGSLSNFASGLMLVFFRPFKAGDYVEAGGVSGSVKTISIFQTILITPDNKEVIVPNGDVYSKPITNYSSTGERRVDLVIGIGYDDDIDKARRLIEAVIGEEKRVLAEPAPQILMLELADSSVNFGVRPWVKTADYWGARSSLLENIKKRFDAEGVSIPYPQRDVHVHQVGSAAAN
ncbi:MAG: mechanosensitive ion channel family protein [Acidobacteria bacterium]|nr:MAG: mechanosensitive ion channel family protein [Acidobacteriota bacterium]REK03846.1 MAG: mechanosensitive ion channel family protein [Acidobacteriota bacterium]